MVNIYLAIPMPNGAAAPADDFGGETLPNKVGTFFRNRDNAVAWAKEKAKEKPGLQIAIVGPVVGVIESTAPVIVEKTVNEAGEIVLKE